MHRTNANANTGRIRMECQDFGVHNARYAADSHFIDEDASQAGQGSKYSRLVCVHRYTFRKPPKPELCVCFADE